MRFGVWARADHAHLALKHVEQLRQLIQAGPAGEAADRCDALIAFRGLNDLVPVVAGGHRAELIDLYLAPRQAVPRLFKQHRPRA